MATFADVSHNPSRCFCGVLFVFYCLNDWLLKRLRVEFPRPGVGDPPPLTFQKHKRHVRSKIMEDKKISK